MSTRPSHTETAVTSYSYVDELEEYKHIRYFPAPGEQHPNCVASEYMKEGCPFETACVAGCVLEAIAGWQIVTAVVAGVTTWVIMNQRTNAKYTGFRSIEEAKRFFEAREVDNNITDKIRVRLAEVRDECKKQGLSPDECGCSESEYINRRNDIIKSCKDLPGCRNPPNWSQVKKYKQAVVDCTDVELKLNARNKCVNKRVEMHKKCFDGQDADGQNHSEIIQNWQEGAKKCSDLLETAQNLILCKSP